MVAKVVHVSESHSGRQSFNKKPECNGVTATCIKLVPRRTMLFLVIIFLLTINFGLYQFYVSSPEFKRLDQYTKHNQSLKWESELHRAIFEESRKIRTIKQSNPVIEKEPVLLAKPNSRILPTKSIPQQKMLPIQKFSQKQSAKGTPPIKKAPEKQPKKISPIKQIPQKQPPQKVPPIKQIPQKQPPQKVPPIKQVPQKQPLQKVPPIKQVPQKQPSNEMPSNKQVSQKQPSNKILPIKEVPQQQPSIKKVPQQQPSQKTPSVKKVSQQQPSKKLLPFKKVPQRQLPHDLLPLQRIFQKETEKKILPIKENVPKGLSAPASLTTSDKNITSSTMLGPVFKFYQLGHTNYSRDICQKKKENIKLLIIVTSALAHKDARMAIRLTWGHYGIRKDVAIAFLMGTTTDQKLKTEVEEEQDLYGDIIIGNFIDSYLNLTLKTVSMLEWVRTYCLNANFVLKTDDDMFINVPSLLDFLFILNPQGRVIYGKLGRNLKPFRNVESKYYVSFEEFRPDVYPEFTTGPAYLFPAKLSTELFTASLMRPFFKLEDVFLTGIVSEDLGIRRIHIPEFHNVKAKLTACMVQKKISIHQIEPYQQFEAWSLLLNGLHICK